VFTSEFLKNARKSAESAVADMADKDLKVAAFTTILGRLLAVPDSKPTDTGTKQPAEAKGARGPFSKSETHQENTLTGRILSVRDDGFFSSQRSLTEVRDELAKHGWHYPVTTLSGAMQSLVRKELRRERVAASETEGRRVWKYSNR